MSDADVVKATKIAEYVGILIILVGLFFFGYSIIKALDPTIITTVMLTIGIGAGLVGGSEAAMVKALQR